jgi:hypothetical protein
MTFWKFAGDEPMLRTAFVLLTIALTIGTAGARDANAPTTPAPIQVSNDQGSDAQRSACTPDVFRLCGQFIPDVAGIVGCLRLQRPNLSPACRAVFR